MLSASRVLSMCMSRLHELWASRRHRLGCSGRSKGVWLTKRRRPSRSLLSQRKSPGDIIVDTIVDGEGDGRDSIHSGTPISSRLEH